MLLLVTFVHPGASLWSKRVYSLLSASLHGFIYQSLVCMLLSCLAIGTETTIGFKGFWIHGFSKLWLSIVVVDNKIHLNYIIHLLIDFRVVMSVL